MPVCILVDNVISDVTILLWYNFGTFHLVIIALDRNVECCYEL